jgi:hypothetical protein
MFSWKKNTDRGYQGAWSQDELAVKRDMRLELIGVESSELAASE